MAPVTNNRSDLIHDHYDPASVPPDPEQARGRMIMATGTALALATDLATSTWHLADIPADVILHEDTFFDVENWPFAQIVIGTLSDTDALVDQTKVTENIVTPIAIGDANHGKRLWEVLGLAANPGGLISLYAHAEGNATGAGNMPFRVAYIAA
ncbi:hypothetical protein KZZ08_00535 [Roseovarius mucosus]|uniref:hypothetical protein n=1 Tax=Roseovarius mucosus TaxID=215743 RepID=UPI001C5FABAC|nr:hypothetical protein [Roseovarius mucosus]MBW4972082.1 hypothetical protein [Roseovarius mucosus]